MWFYAIFHGKGSFSEFIWLLDQCENALSACLEHGQLLTSSIKQTWEWKSNYNEQTFLEHFLCARPYGQALWGIGRFVRCVIFRVLTSKRGGRDTRVGNDGNPLFLLYQSRRNGISQAGLFFRQYLRAGNASSLNYVHLLSLGLAFYFFQVLSLGRDEPISSSVIQLHWLLSPCSNLMTLFGDWFRDGHVTRFWPIKHESKALGCFWKGFLSRDNFVVKGTVPEVDWSYQLCVIRKVTSPYLPPFPHLLNGVKDNTHLMGLW